MNKLRVATKRKYLKETNLGAKEYNQIENSLQEFNNNLYVEKNEPTDSKSV